MHYINGVRQSPFPENHWTDGMEQKDIVQALISNGSAMDYLKKLSHESAVNGYFTAIDRTVFMENDSQLDDYLKFDEAASLIIMIRLEEAQENVISYKNKEVGALIRFPHRYPNDEGIIHTDVLIEEAGKMELNPAQLAEAEKLLNKVGRTLGLDLPDIPAPTDQEKYRAISHLTFNDIQKKPRRYYDIFVGDMLAAGTPVTMTAKQFREYAEKVLKPS